MDISQLQLKIDKNQAVTDLKSVEGQLNKTATAGESLIGTLKDIGLSVGFSKLVKDTLKINVELKAIDKRFKTVFGKDAPIEGVKDLTTEFNLSNHEAKSLLSYIGQFSKGLKQTSAFTKEFSVNLAKIATDYATYMGGLDVNDVAKKMAKSTLGETGELKEIGIVIDAQSESFKNLTKNIQEQTGVTEAQAKQMAIYKRLLEETAHVAGASQENMMDGFTQLTSLLNNFKEVLAKVGQVFSAIFAPGLNFINSILSTKLGQWATAATIALTSLGVGLYSISNLFEKLKASVQTSNIAEDIKKVVDIHKRWVAEAKKVAEKYNAIYRTLRHAGAINFTNKANFSDLNSKERKALKQVIDLLPSPRMKQEWNDAQKGFEGLKKELKDLNIIQSDLSDTMKEQVGNTWKYLSAEKTLSLTRKTAIATVLAQAAAEKVNTFNKMLSAGTSAIGGIFGLFAGVWAFIKTFTIKAGAALAAIAGKILLFVAAIGAVFDSIKAITNLFQGKNYWEGTFGGLIGDKIGWALGGGDKAVETSKKIDEQLKTLKDQRSTWNSLMKELADIKFGESLKGLSLDQEITKLREKKRKLEESLNNQQLLINDFLKRSQDASISQEERSKAADLRNEAQAKYNQLLREKITIDENIISKQKVINDLNKKYAEDILKIADKLRSAKSAFAFGYKDGVFQNLSDQVKQQQRVNRQLDLQKRIQNRFNKNDLGSLTESKNLTTELFDVTKEIREYELNSLEKQRQAAIKNLESMQALVNESMKLNSTLQSGVEAGSMEAVKLQNRQMDLSARSLQPLAEQQQEIKDIETKMLDHQSRSIKILEKVGRDLSEITTKVGKAQGVTIKAVDAFN